MALGHDQNAKSHSEKVSQLFGTIATRYDVLNDILSIGLHRRWKRRLAQLANVCPGQLALDVCCGTGDVSFELAKRGAKVIGLDFNRAMLDIARRRQRAKQSTNLTCNAQPINPVFVLSDAHQLPFAPDTFDALTISYGLRNLANWQFGLREMMRVVKPGGHLLVLDFGKPANQFLRSLYFGYVAIVVPAIGKLGSGHIAPYQYLIESLRQYPAQHGVPAKMRELGLTNVQTIDLLGGIMSIIVAQKP